jgi:hypothetical protein
MQPIPKPFKRSAVELREFIQNVESTYEVVPSNYSLLCKFVYAQIGGEAKAKLLARTLFSRSLLSRESVCLRTCLICRVS